MPMRDGYADYLESYLPVLVIVVVGIVLVTDILFGNKLLSPSRPTAAKQLTYECGVDPVGDGWAQAHIRYYVFALLFLVFDVEAAFLFPWAVIYRNLGVYGFVEMVIFVSILAVGLVYAWKKGALKWV